MSKRGKKNSRLFRPAGWLLKIAAALALLGVFVILLLRWAAPPTSAFMLRQRLSGATVDYRWVPLQRISPYAVLAVIASEDQNFFNHRGIDFDAVRDAIEDNRERERPRGASTISQQVAKNLFLWPGPSYVRKGMEACLTLVIEALWPKKRILEVYLNIAEMGRGVFGVQAASLRFFGKPAQALDRRQAATLAAVLPAPRRMPADRPSAYLLKRSRQIQQQMDLMGGLQFLKRHDL